MQAFGTGKVGNVKHRFNVAMLWFRDHFEAGPIRFLRTPFYNTRTQTQMARSELVLTTDACTAVGAGGFSSLGHWFQVTWAMLNVFGLSINMLELLAAIAFAIVVANPIDFHVVLYIDSVLLTPLTALLPGAEHRWTDNTAAQAALNKCACKNRIGNAWLKQLAYYEWGSPLRVSAKRISTT